LDERQKKSGKGIVTFTSGNVFDGQLSDDRPHGHGIMHCKEGGILKISVEGKWVRGILEGKSTVILYNGSDKLNTLLYDPEEEKYSDFLLPSFFPELSDQ